MMNDPVDCFVRLNLAVSLAIFVVLVSRMPAQRLFGPRVAYGLWGLVPCVLFAGFLPSRERVIFLPERPEQVRLVEGFSYDLELFLICLWMAGVLFTLGLVLWQHRRFVRGLGVLVPEGRYLRSERDAAGPLVLGVRRPRIVLPAGFEHRFEADDRALILAHEDAHIARHDTRINGLVALGQCVFWFNPFVHIAANRLRRDQEMACDATVLSTRPQARRAYAEALLRSHLPLSCPAMVCAWPARGANPLKERLIMLKIKTPSDHRALCGVAMIGLLMTASAATAWATQPARLRVVQAPEVATAEGQELESKGRSQAAPAVDNEAAIPSRVAVHYTAASKTVAVSGKQLSFQPEGQGYSIRFVADKEKANGDSAGNVAFRPEGPDYNVKIGKNGPVFNVKFAPDASKSGAVDPVTSLSDGNVAFHPEGPDYNVKIGKNGPDFNVKFVPDASKSGAVDPVTPLSGERQ